MTKPIFGLTAPTFRFPLARRSLQHHTLQARPATAPVLRPRRFQAGPQPPFTNARGAQTVPLVTGHGAEPFGMRKLCSSWSRLFGLPNIKALLIFTS